MYIPERDVECQAPAFLLSGWEGSPGLQTLERGRLEIGPLLVVGEELVDNLGALPPMPIMLLLVIC